MYVASTLHDGQGMANFGACGSNHACKLTLPQINQKNSLLPMHQGFLIVGEISESQRAAQLGMHSTQCKFFFSIWLIFFQGSAQSNEQDAEIWGLFPYAYSGLCGTGLPRLESRSLRGAMHSSSGVGILGTGGGDVGEAAPTADAPGVGLEGA